MESPHRLAYPLLTSPRESPERELYPMSQLYGMYVPPEPTAPPADWASMPAGGAEEEKAGDVVCPVEPPVFIEHAVLQSDTLQGVLLRYGLSLRELKRFNQFPRENFRILKKLKIPLTRGAKPVAPEPTRAEILYDFTKVHHVTEHEARYYLQEASWDVARAKEALFADVAWEEEKRGGLRHRAPVRP